MAVEAVCDQNAKLGLVGLVRLAPAARMDMEDTAIGYRQLEIGRIDMNVGNLITSHRSFVFVLVIMMNGRRMVVCSGDVCVELRMVMDSKTGLPPVSVVVLC